MALVKGWRYYGVFEGHDSNGVPIYAATCRATPDAGMGVYQGKDNTNEPVYAVGECETLDTLPKVPGVFQGFDGNGNPVYVTVCCPIGDTDGDGDGIGFGSSSSSAGSASGGGSKDKLCSPQHTSCGGCIIGSGVWSINPLGPDDWQGCMSFMQGPDWHNLWHLSIAEQGYVSDNCRVGLTCEGTLSILGPKGGEIIYQADSIPTCDDIFAGGAPAFLLTLVSDEECGGSAPQHLTIVGRGDCCTTDTSSSSGSVQIHFYHCCHTECPACIQGTNPFGWATCVLKVDMGLEFLNDDNDCDCEKYNGAGADENGNIQNLNLILFWKGECVWQNKYGTVTMLFENGQWDLVIDDGCVSLKFTNSGWGCCTGGPLIIFENNGVCFGYPTQASVTTFNADDCATCWECPPTSPECFLYGENAPSPYWDIIAVGPDKFIGDCEYLNAIHVEWNEEMQMWTNDDCSIQLTIATLTIYILGYNNVIVYQVLDMGDAHCPEAPSPPAPPPRLKLQWSHGIACGGIPPALEGTGKNCCAPSSGSASSESSSASVSSSSGELVFTDCCPDGLPSVLNVSMPSINDCDCATTGVNTCQLFYDPFSDKWLGSLPLGDCGHTLDLEFYCEGGSGPGDFRLFIYRDGTLGCSGDEFATPIGSSCGDFTFEYSNAACGCGPSGDMQINVHV